MKSIFLKLLLSCYIFRAILSNMPLCYNEWRRSYSASMCAGCNLPTEQKLTVGIFFFFFGKGTSLGRTKVERSDYPKD